jgi:hypothetical protein
MKAMLWSMTHSPTLRYLSMAFFKSLDSIFSVCKLGLGQFQLVNPLTHW